MCRSNCPNAMQFILHLYVIPAAYRLIISLTVTCKPANQLFTLYSHTNPSPYLSRMKLSVIVVNYNVKYFLEVCLHSVLRAAAGIDAEVIVVDNNSSDSSCAMLRELFPSVVVIENKDNKGFSKANNQAVAIAR